MCGLGYEEICGLRNRHLIAEGGNDLASLLLMCVVFVGFVWLSTTRMWTRVCCLVHLMLPGSAALIITCSTSPAVPIHSHRSQDSSEFVLSCLLLAAAGAAGHHHI